MNKLILFILCFIICSCTNENEAKRVLEMDGFSNVQVTGYKFFTCGRDDFFHTGFVAQKNGKTVEGAVCSGLLFKGSTIRF